METFLGIALLVVWGLFSLLTERKISQCPPQPTTNDTLFVSKYEEERKWRSFESAIKTYKKNTEDLKYVDFFGPQPAHSTLKFYVPRITRSKAEPKSPLTEEEVDNLLSADLSNALYGVSLLSRIIPQEIPKLPTMINDIRSLDYLDENQRRLLDEYELIKTQREKLEKSFKKRHEANLKMAARIVQSCEKLDPEALRLLLCTTLYHNPPPLPLTFEPKIAFDFEAKVVLCSLDLPELAKLPILRSNKKLDWKPLPKSQGKKAAEKILYSICIRTAYIIARTVGNEAFQIVVVNANQHWNDAATGFPREGIVASLQANIKEIKELQLATLEPKACFQYFKGISTPSIEKSSPIRPVFILNMEDERIVENRDVAKNLESETNIAAMPWEDFEHLVRQLFEWEFATKGIEVKVTRASRDRGVDAIMYDPDPLRGGKYVLQAKRYTRLVDVAAVRDLYGTIMNEGANRGILVTTSSYGPDAYEFAKDKPISLMDGPKLIEMLQKHGRNYRVDLEEARRVEKDEQQSPSY